MNISKGNNTLNYLFGAFLLLSAIKLSSDLYTRHKKGKASEKKGCGCGNK